MRTRVIKPSLFTNEDLAEVSIWARYLFAGLWCIADRGGKLEDRPKKIKAEIFPYDDVNVDELLYSLSEFGFIQRYTVGDKGIIFITNFVKHQKIHPNEAKSILPNPPYVPLENQGVPLENQGVPLENQGVPLENQGVQQSNFKDFMLTLITEYNRVLPMCRKMDYQFLGQEPRWVKEIWKVFPESQGLPFWTEIFEEVKKSAWLTSKASFPFLITLDRIKEILAGKYHEAEKEQIKPIIDRVKPERNYPDAPQKLGLSLKKHNPEATSQLP